MERIKTSDWEKLAAIVDDTAIDVYIPTPKGWRCKKKGCLTRFKHSHGTYQTL